MKTPFTKIEGAVTAPRGFRAAAVAAGIKRGGKLDMAMIVSDTPATAAATFTTNQVKAAPVKVSMQHITKGRACAIVVNSGNANACTGTIGLIHAEAMAAAVARRIGCRETNASASRCPSSRSKAASRNCSAAFPPTAARPRRGES